jgi:fibronectin type 3 domain-containing protein
VAPVATLLWILGAVFLLNVLIAGWLVTLELVERRRLDKEIREVDTLWRSLTMPQTESAGWGSPLGIGVKQRTPVLHRLPAPPRSVGKASVGLAVAASALWVVVAALGPGEPPVVSARGLESPTQQAGDGERQTETDTSSTPGSKGISGTAASPQASSDATLPNTTAASGAAAVPAAVAAEPHSSTAIYVEWAGVPEATGYEVERAEGTQQGWLTVVTVEEHVTAYTDGGLDAGTTYFYRVSALTDSGAAPPPSDVVSATTPTGAVPAATTVTAVAALDTITLTWIDVGDETGYRIERSPDGATGWAGIGTAGQGVLVYTDSALAPGTTYYYRIVATNAAGDSAPSNVVFATTETEKVSEQPPAPDGSATPSNGAPAGDVPSGGALAEDALAATTESTDGALAGTLAEGVLVTDGTVVLEPTP